MTPGRPLAKSHRFLPRDATRTGSPGSHCVAWSCLFCQDLFHGPKPFPKNLFRKWENHHDAHPTNLVVRIQRVANACHIGVVDGWRVEGLFDSGSVMAGNRQHWQRKTTLIQLAYPVRSFFLLITFVTGCWSYISQSLSTYVFWLTHVSHHPLSADNSQASWATAFTDSRPSLPYPLSR